MRPSPVSATMKVMTDDARLGAASPPSPPSSTSSAVKRLPELTRAAMWWTAVVITVLTAGAVTVLWRPATAGLTGADLVKARLDALKIGLSIGVGSGGVVALYLAWRRQHSTEADLDNREHTLAHQQEVAAATRCGGPIGIRKAGRRKLASIATKNAPRMGAKLVEDIISALEEQTVVVPGTSPADTVLPRLADSLKSVLLQSPCWPSQTAADYPVTRIGRTSTSSTATARRCRSRGWHHSADQPQRHRPHRRARRRPGPCPGRPGCGAGREDCRLQRRRPA